MVLTPAPMRLSPTPRRLPPVGQHVAYTVGVHHERKNIMGIECLAGDYFEVGQNHRRKASELVVIEVVVEVLCSRFDLLVLLLPLLLLLHLFAQQIDSPKPIPTFAVYDKCPWEFVLEMQRKLMTIILSVIGLGVPGQSRSPDGGCRDCCSNGERRTLQRVTWKQ